MQTFSQTGHVGIGTTSPTATLHVKTSNPYIIRIEDGVDTSDSFYTIQSEDNFGTFKKVPTEVFRKIQISNLPSVGSTISQAANNWQTTSVSITVPPGKWQITGALVLRPSENLSAVSDVVLNCHLTVADNATSTTPSSDILAGAAFGQGYFIGSYYAPSSYEIMRGNVYVHNSSGASKTYYFIANIARINSTTANFANFGSSTENENQLFAIPVY